jgi:SAM-dependent methyltransferase
VPEVGSTDRSVAPGPDRFLAIRAEDYERYRPDYAVEAGAWMAERAGLGSDSVVADVGAGTGKLTRLFTERAGTVIAVEPAANMLAKLREVVPRARAVGGTAEAMPLRDGSADLVGVGHAFHHFVWPEALAEIHRVLHPGGWLALVWALADPEDPLEPAIAALVAPHLPASEIREAFDAWRDAFADGRFFEPEESRFFPHEQRLPPSSLPTLMATSSDVASLANTGRVTVLAEIEGFAATLPDPLVVRRITQVHLFRRRD